MYMYTLYLCVCDITNILKMLSQQCMWPCVCRSMTSAQASTCPGPTQRLLVSSVSYQTNFLSNLSNILQNWCLAVSKSLTLWN